MSSYKTILLDAVSVSSIICMNISNSDITFYLSCAVGLTALSLNLIKLFEWAKKKFFK
jgi:hypothetical protein